jgi:hypothetical protein
MTTRETTGISRRRFIASASLATAAAWLGINHLMAGEIGLVKGARKKGATAKITVQRLRGKVSVIFIPG